MLPWRAFRVAGAFTQPTLRFSTGLFGATSPLKMPAALGIKKGVGEMGDLSGKKVIMRVDFNVPVGGGKVTDDYRIKSTVPTIKKILEKGASLILMSHLGRPSGKGYEAEYTLKVTVDVLAGLLGKPVAFAEDCMNADAQVAALKPGDVLLLENLRFYPEEGAKKEEDRMKMATKLASYADLYVSDAFGTAHRDAASMTGVPKVKGQGFCGDLMKKECDYFTRALRDPARPVVAILGGAKVSDKILVLENLMNLVDKMVIGGAMAYTFLRAQGKSTGKSKTETEAATPDGKGKIDIVQLASDLLAKAKTKNVEIYLPIDHKCAKEFGNEEPTISDGPDVPEDLLAMDIGPKTMAKFCEVIKGCKTALWNGPMGVFEKSNYASGTFAIAHVLAETDILSIVGGGDSASAAEKSGVADKLSHISTGGGASLELLEGKVLPGIACLDDA